MSPRTQRVAINAVATWHDELLDAARLLKNKDRSDPIVDLHRRKVAGRLLDARHAIRELRKMR